MKQEQIELPEKGYNTLTASAKLLVHGQRVKLDQQKRVLDYYTVTGSVKAYKQLHILILSD